MATYQWKLPARLVGIIRAQKPVSACSSVQPPQTSKASSLMSPKSHKRRTFMSTWICLFSLARAKCNLLSPLTWGTRGGAHFSDIIHVTETVCHSVLLLCCVGATPRRGFLHQRWGQVEGRAWPTQEQVAYHSKLRRKSFVLSASMHIIMGQGSD